MIGNDYNNFGRNIIIVRVKWHQTANSQNTEVWRIP